MENLIESNERTLVIFDSVCSGLAACISLVHTDIRQMTEHRNRLAQLEQEQIRAKLIPAEELAAEVSLELRNQNNNHSSATSQNNGIKSVYGNSNSNVNANAKTKDAADGASLTGATSAIIKMKKNKSEGKPDAKLDYQDRNDAAADDDDDDDPHHLSKLKLLDKRLADSFSRALSMNDLQKSSLSAKTKRTRASNRTSIFQVLLGRSSSSSSKSSGHNNNNNCTNSLSRSETNFRNSKKRNGQAAEATIERFDNKTIIDDINRQTRLAMQYSKQLEAHLFKVEDLRSKYEMHLKMGLVVKSVNSKHLQHQKQKDEADHQNTTGGKTTIKEFIENINRIESEFESYMGSFLLAIEDLQGFARVCQGDVFEITIKYGETQKFKTKITVLKDNKQKCDNRQIVFKARIADVLAIKAYECKGLGKWTRLGHKLCETRDLFTARSQLMTISLNQTGSIKLNIIVTWNPLHLAPSSSASVPGLDISHISLPATPISSSTLSSISSTSVPSVNGINTTTINIQSNPQRNGRPTIVPNNPSDCLYHHHHHNHHHHEPTTTTTTSTTTQMPKPQPASPQTPQVPLDASRHRHGLHSHHLHHHNHHQHHLNQQHQLPNQSPNSHAARVGSHQEHPQQILPQQHQHQHMSPQDSMYQAVDPTYGYYIPPPDYVTHEAKY